MVIKFRTVETCGLWSHMEPVLQFRNYSCGMRIIAVVSQLQLPVLKTQYLLALLYQNVVVYIHAGHLLHCHVSRLG